MSFVPREYPEIVRDLLTTLTAGTVNESLLVPSDFDEPLLLKERPVRRVSHLQGTIELGSGDQTQDIAYRFTPADFELVSLSGEPDEFDAIRFRQGGKLPKPNTILTVNYYPVSTSPLAVTDLNVGSVIRTVIETVAREMTMGYLNLDSVYKSAYLETAEGNALDKVVALVGVKRLPAGHPLVPVRFIRQQGGSGRISVPSGTSVTDDSGNRYLTLTELVLEPGETNRDVLCAGESAATKLVEEAKLDRLEVLVAGISSVTNPEHARQQNSPETDEALRRRTRTALSGAVRGTVKALEFAVKSVPGVRTVSVIERPNNIAGEIKMEVAYDSDTDETKALVADRILEYRPAGIRVISAVAASTEISVDVSLTLAGARLADPEIQAVKTGIDARLTSYLESLPSDGKVRPAKLTSLIMQDERVVDATVSISPDVISQASTAVLDVNAVTYGAIAYEQAEDDSIAIVAQVSVDLPVLLEAGADEASVKSEIEASIASFLASRSQTAPLTTSALLDEIRDDALFAAVRSDALLTVEDSKGQFLQLSDDAGSYTPSSNETLQVASITIDFQGGV